MMFILVLSQVLVYSAEPAYVEVDGPILRVSSPPKGVVLINEIDVVAVSQHLSMQLTEDGNRIQALEGTVNTMVSALFGRQHKHGEGRGDSG
jgi:hypothetical protein